jgi:N-(5'phosphoribosyl)anthranilate (PRA) isomerase
MMVKICGINNLEDALAAIGGGAAAVGFNFWPGSPRYITPESARRVIERLPDAVNKVGVFVAASGRAIFPAACGSGKRFAFARISTGTRWTDIRLKRYCWMDPGTASRLSGPWRRAFPGK